MYSLNESFLAQAILQTGLESDDTTSALAVLTGFGSTEARSFTDNSRAELSVGLQQSLLQLREAS